MWWSTKLTNRSSSRRQINIIGIEKGLLILPGNRYACALRSSSLNFELKSEPEQDILIENYQAFLNSLPCPIQIVVRTREVDIDKYLDHYRLLKQSEPSDIYRQLADSYIEFVQGLIKNSKILGRHFYIIIPLSVPSDTTLGEVRQQLDLYTDLIIKGLARLDLKLSRLSSLEILELFYGLYSPLQAKLQPLKALKLGQLASAL